MKSENLKILILLIRRIPLLVRLSRLTVYNRTEEVEKICSKLNRNKHDLNLQYFYLSELYKNLKDYENADLYFWKRVEIREGKINNRELLIYIKSILSYLYKIKKNYQLAITYTDKLMKLAKKEETVILLLKIQVYCCRELENNMKLEQVIKEFEHHKNAEIRVIIDRQKEYIKAKRDV